MAVRFRPAPPLFGGSDCILGCFPEGGIFSLGGCHSLSFQQQVAQVLVSPSHAVGINITANLTAAGGSLAKTFDMNGPCAGLLRLGELTSALPPAAPQKFSTIKMLLSHTSAAMAKYRPSGEGIP